MCAHTAVGLCKHNHTVDCTGLSESRATNTVGDARNEAVGYEQTEGRGKPPSWTVAKQRDVRLSYLHAIRRMFDVK